MVHSRDAPCKFAVIERICGIIFKLKVAFIRFFIYLDLYDQDHLASSVFASEVVEYN